MGGGSRGGGGGGVGVEECIFLKYRRETLNKAQLYMISFQFCMFVPVLLLPIVELIP